MSDQSVKGCLQYILHIMNRQHFLQLRIFFYIQQFNLYWENGVLNQDILIILCFMLWYFKKKKKTAQTLFCNFPPQWSSTPQSRLKNSVTLLLDAHMCH